MVTAVADPEIKPKPIRVAHAAKSLGVCGLTIRQWITDGLTIVTPRGRKRIALRARKVGGCWMIQQADLDEFVKVTTDASISPDALPAAGSVETDAQFRRRAAETKARVAKRLSGGG